MQLTFVALALAAGGGAHQLAQPPTRALRSPPTLVERDLATISSVLAQVGDGLTQFDTAVKSYNPGDQNSQDGFNAAASGLQQTLQSGTATVQQTSNISTDDAVSLQNQVTALQGAANALVSDLNGKKDAVQQAGQCEAVRQQVSGITDQGKALVAAVVSKVPDDIQSTVQQLVSGSLGTLDDASAAYSAANCTDNTAAASAGGTTSTAEPPSTVPTSAGGGGGGSGSCGNGNGNGNGNVTTAGVATPTTSTPAIFTGGAAVAAAMNVAAVVAAVAAAIL